MLKWCTNIPLSSRNLLPYMRSSVDLILCRLLLSTNLLLILYFSVIVLSAAISKYVHVHKVNIQTVKRENVKRKKNSYTAAISCLNEFSSTIETLDETDLVSLKSVSYSGKISVYVYKYLVFDFGAFYARCV